MSEFLKTLLAFIRVALEILAGIDDDDGKEKPKDPTPPVDPPDPVIPPVVPVPPVPGKNDLAQLRADLLIRHNVIRKANGRSALWSLGELDTIAQAQAEYQASINGWRDLHGRPPGKSLKSDLSTLTFDYRSGGENAAAGHATALDVVAGWKNSPGHFKNMIGSQFEHVGFGYAKSTKGTNYWVAVFVG